jgi:serine O-acetyltransferase
VQDPSCKSYSQALLYFKGYHAIQLYRFAHELWRQNRKAMSLSLQSRLSEVLAVDIHPAAQIKKGILMDHGTGVVIGETAVIGNGVSIMQVRHRWPGPCM